MIKGIDVSKNQPKINWAQVKADGYGWAIIRTGYQGYSKGGFQPDPLFRAHIEGALAVGLPVGVYWICQAVSEQESIAAADYCCDLIAPYETPLGVWWDNEPTAVYPAGRADKLDKAARTAMGVAFLEQIERHGRRTGIYTNLDYLTYKLDYSQLEKYPLWLAQWKGSQPSRKCDIWQYDAGPVAGIPVKTDRNILYNDALLGSARLAKSAVPYEAVITATVLNVRSAPGLSGRKIGVVRKGQVVKILTVTDGWGKVEFVPAKFGWIFLEHTIKK